MKQGFPLAMHGIAGSIALLAAVLPGLVMAEESPEPLPAASSPEELPANDAPSFRETAAGQPPFGVNNGAALEKGGFEIYYRYSRVRLRKNRIGTKQVSTQRAFADQAPAYRQLPEKRLLQEHLVGLSWAPFSRLTLSAKLPLYVRDQTTQDFSGARLGNRTEGIGDLQLVALVPFMRKGDETLLFSLGFQAPTGSNRKNGSNDQRLGYPMQPGTGSWAIIPGATYRGHWKQLSWGLNYAGAFFLDVNREGYRPGTRQEVSTWMAWNFSQWFSSSVRIKWNRMSNIHGGDSALGSAPYADPTADPKRRKGQWLAIGPGVNFRLPCCGGQRVAFEALFPIWQDLEGPQLESRWLMYAGVQLGF